MPHRQRNRFMIRSEPVTSTAKGAVNRIRHLCGPRLSWHDQSSFLDPRVSEAEHETIKVESRFRSARTGRRLKASCWSTCVAARAAVSSFREDALNTRRSEPVIRPPCLDQQGRYTITNVSLVRCRRRGASAARFCFKPISATPWPAASYASRNFSAEIFPERPGTSS